HAAQDFTVGDTQDGHPAHMNGTPGGRYVHQGAMVRAPGYPTHNSTPLLDNRVLGVEVQVGESPQVHLHRVTLAVRAVLRRGLPDIHAFVIRRVQGHDPLDIVSVPGVE